MFLDEHFAEKAFLEGYCMLWAYFYAAHTEDTFLGIDFWRKVFFFERQGSTGAEFHTCFALHTLLLVEIGDRPEEPFKESL